ncbi:MAG: hypothetical protein LBF88_03765 [Planctomycetaceae bacterium]|jgi:hypothetical protein|nr:hypothetical protein [Planctomycetaceae bacterium]
MSIAICFFPFFSATFRNYFGKTLENKEHHNGKFSEMFDRTFGNVFGKKPNVKMGKTGGGGLDVEES